MLKNLLYFSIGGLFLALAAGVGYLDTVILNAADMPGNIQIMISWSFFGIFTYFMFKGGISQ